MRDYKFHPESHMMSYGYQPELSEGAVKCPHFPTSTFVFHTAEEGKAFFELAYGKRDAEIGETQGLIYSRINNPNLEIAEHRLRLWDGAEGAALFASGMAAISTVFMEFLKPGDLLLYSQPVYGGTDHFIKHILLAQGIEAIGFTADDDPQEIKQRVLDHKGRLSLIYIETPSNPTNSLIDIADWAAFGKELSTDTRPVFTAVDNTYLGPIWQHPLKHGADLVLYSATKYIGGHSDIVAGAVLGSADLIARVKGMRTFMGNMCAPWTAWMLMRSLETLKLRMEQQASAARQLADYLVEHPAVERVNYLGHLDPVSEQGDIFARQCRSAGAMISFEVNGGEKEAFRFLNALKLIKLAVSLGGTESLAEHPRTMTHAGVDPRDCEQLGISHNLVRLSIGVEHPDDLLRDIEQALASMSTSSRLEYHQMLGLPVGA